MKKVLLLGLAIGLILLSVPALLCTAMLWIPQIITNAKLNAFADQLFDYPLPEQTRVVSRDKWVGLTGNSNHCDYFVGQTIETALPLADIKRYYADVTFLPPGGRNEGMEPNYQTAPITPDILANGKTMGDGHQQVSIILASLGHSPGLDIRCH